MINSYNPVVLRHWRANMDIQVISNAEGAAYYVCSYICKSEPDELKMPWVILFTAFLILTQAFQDMSDC